MAKKLRKDVWTIYAVYGFSQPYGDNRAADGCVTLHQVRCKNWKWQERRVNVNCCETSESDPWEIPSIEAAELWQRAKKYNA